MRHSDKTPSMSLLKPLFLLMWPICWQFHDSGTTKRILLISDMIHSSDSILFLTIRKPLNIHWSELRHLETHRSEEKTKTGCSSLVHVVSGLWLCGPVSGFEHVTLTLCASWFHLGHHTDGDVMRRSAQPRARPTAAFTFHLISVI